MRPKVCKETVRRLPIYLRCLQRFEHSEGRDQVLSSECLASMAGVKPTQLRKDLASFGEFGRRGLGYNVSALKDEIRRILKLDRDVSLVVIGLGSLGTAFTRYIATRRMIEDGYPFKIVGICDKDEQKIGGCFMGVPVFGVSELGTKLAELKPDIVVIAVPSEVTEAMTSFCTKCGVKAVMSFAPPTSLPSISDEGVVVHNIDLGLELEYLSFFS